MSVFQGAPLWGSTWYNSIGMSDVMGQGEDGLQDRTISVFWVPHCGVLHGTIPLGLDTVYRIQ